MFPEFDTATLFFLSSVALALVPGPDNLFVLAQAALYGTRAGLFVTLGLCTGLVFHTSAVAAGIAALVATSPIAFLVLKIVGAGYLLLLAWKSFRAGDTSAEGQEGVTHSMAALYRRGIFMNITNPKVALFFLAFLPQFTDPDRGSVAIQIVVLGVLFMVATLLIFGAIAVCSSLIGEFLRRSPKAQRNMNWLAGALFTGLAVKLLASDQ